MYKSSFFSRKSFNTKFYVVVICKNEDVDYIKNILASICPTEYISVEKTKDIEETNKKNKEECLNFLSFIKRAKDTNHRPELHYLQKCNKSEIKDRVNKALLILYS